MRSSPKVQAIVDNSDNPIGVCLSADHVAEHEWGISTIKHTLGVTSDDATFGFQARTVHNLIPFFEFEKQKITLKSNIGKESTTITTPVGVLTCASQFFIDGDEHEFIKKIIDNRKYCEFFKGTFSSRDADTYTAIEDGALVFKGEWSSDNFFIIGYGAKSVDLLRKLHESSSSSDVIITLGSSGNPFGGGGLNIIKASDIPTEVADDLYQSDKESYELHKEAKDTGIEEVLKSAGKSWYALSPRRMEDGSICWWLNPRDQQDNNYGWFNYEQLALWAKDEGPIPIRSE